MDKDIIRRIADCMQDAYHNTRTRREAYKYVTDRYPDFAHDILVALWEANDAGEHFIPIFK